MQAENKRARAVETDTGSSGELHSIYPTATKLQAPTLHELTLSEAQRIAESIVGPCAWRGAVFHSLNRCPSCEAFSPFEVNERGGPCDVKCVHCDWNKSGWFFEVLSAATLTRRYKESPFEVELYGAFGMLGLSSSPRPDGSGITFVCPNGCESRLVLDEGVSCPKCVWSAKGEPWEIAKAASAAKTVEGEEDAEKPLRSPLNVKHLYAALDEQYPKGYPGAPGVPGVRIGFACPRCPGTSHLSVEMFAVTCRACSWTAKGESGSESEIASVFLAAWNGGAN